MAPTSDGSHFTTIVSEFDFFLFLLKFVLKFSRPNSSRITIIKVVPNTNVTPI